MNVPDGPDPFLDTPMSNGKTRRQALEEMRVESQAECLFADPDLCSYHGFGDGDCGGPR